MKDGWQKDKGSSFPYGWDITKAKRPIERVPWASTRDTNLLLSALHGNFNMVVGAGSRISHTRTGTTVGLAPDGKYKIFAEDEPVIGADGYYCSPQATNKCTCYSLLGADQTGPELFTNGDFSAWTAGAPDGWSVVAAGDALSSITEVSGACRIFANGGANTYLSQAITTPNMSFTLEFDIVDFPVGSLDIWSGYTIIKNILAGTTGHQSISLTGQSSSPSIFFSAPAGNIVDVTIDNTSLTELGGTATDGSFVSGLGTGAKSYYDGTSFIQAVPGITLAGDTTSTLEVITDQAELELLGLLDGINPSWKVYKLDNSAGATYSYVNFPGVTVNINAHQVKVFLRGGSGIIAATNAPPGFAGGHAVAFAASTNYARIAESVVPYDISSFLRITADIGQVVYFIAPELIEGSTAISKLPPILVEGAATTVYRDYASVPSASNYSQTEGTIFVEYTPDDISAYNRIIDIGSTTVFAQAGFAKSEDWDDTICTSTNLILSGTNKIGVRYTATGLVFQVVLNGVAAPACVFTKYLGILIALLKFPVSGSSIKNISIYDYAMSEAELITRTSL